MTTRVGRRASMLLVAMVACRAAPASLPEAPRDAATSRAALATLIVDNRTDRRLAVGYDYLESGGGRVLLEHLPAATRDTLAAVPAREPIILFARDDAGAMLRNGPLALEIDSTFVWAIPADATFQPPP